MLKTISAALLAVSMLAAPAFAATAGNIAQVPSSKAEPMKPAKPRVAHAHAHHRSHKHIAANKTPRSSKVTTSHVAPATKRG